jgi:hypothetical protein
MTITRETLLADVHRIANRVARAAEVMRRCESAGVLAGSAPVALSAGIADLAVAKAKLDNFEKAAARVEKRRLLPDYGPLYDKTYG